MSQIESKITDAAGAFAGGQAQSAAPQEHGIDLEELAEILVRKLREEIILENERTGRT